MTPPKTGRPPLPHAKRISLVLTDADDSSLRRMAETDGLSKSAFARLLLRQEAKRRSRKDG